MMRRDFERKEQTAENCTFLSKFIWNNFQNLLLEKLLAKSSDQTDIFWKFHSPADTFWSPKTVGRVLCYTTVFISCDYDSLNVKKNKPLIQSQCKTIAKSMQDESFNIGLGSWTSCNPNWYVLPPLFGPSYIEVSQIASRISFST